MTGPLVSIIMPVYNGARWLPETIASIQAQTYQSWELIAVDDGSSDNSLEVLKQLAPDAKVIRAQHGGIGAARNHGLAHAQGKYLAFIDQDDLWLAHKIEQQVRSLEEHLDTVVCYADAEEFGSQGTIHTSFFARFPALQRPDAIVSALLSYAVPLMSGLMVRSSFVREHGISFDAEASGVDDIGFLLEIALDGGRFSVITEALIRRRLHDTNLSKNEINRQQKRVTLYTNLMQRRRLEPRQAAAVKRAIQEAHYRLGECYWVARDMTNARENLRKARHFNLTGLRAAFYWLLSPVRRWS